MATQTSATSAAAYPAALSGLTPREAVQDTIFRAVVGIDTDNQELFDSAFTQDAVFDLNGNLLTGLEAINANMFAHVSKLDTTHLITNPRVSIKPATTTGGREAILTATALAQHYRPGEGMNAGSQRLLTGCLYELEVVEEDPRDSIWKIKFWKLKIVWTEGDISIVQPDDL